MVLNNVYIFAENLRNMVIDNFDKIRQYLTFDEDDFYFVQIIQRKKDGNPDLVSSNNNYRKVKSFHIQSLEDFDRRRKSIMDLCRQNNARAYIYMNRRNFCSVAIDNAIEILTNFKLGTPKKAKESYDSCCSKYCKPHIKKKFLVDVDTKDEATLNEFIRIVNSCRSEFNKDGIYDVCTRNVLDVIPTKNGFHLFTVGFDKGMFIQRIDEYNTTQHNGTLFTKNELKNLVMKDGQTLLYYEDNE